MFLRVLKPFLYYTCLAAAGLSPLLLTGCIGEHSDALPENVKLQVGENIAVIGATTVMQVTWAKDQGLMVGAEPPKGYTRVKLQFDNPDIHANPNKFFTITYGNNCHRLHYGESCQIRLTTKSDARDLTKQQAISVNGGEDKTDSDLKIKELTVVDSADANAIDTGIVTIGAGQQVTLAVNNDIGVPVFDFSEGVKLSANIPGLSVHSECDQKNELEPGDSCHIILTAPTTVTENKNVELTQEGAGGDVVNEQISLIHPEIAFADVNQTHITSFAMTGGAYQDVLVKNLTPVPVKGGHFSLSSGSAVSITQNDCPSILAADTSCLLKLHAPGTTAVHTDTLTLSAGNMADHTLPITVNPSHSTLVLSWLDYTGGSFALSSLGSRDFNLQVDNTGLATITGLSIQPLPADFSVVSGATTPCGGSLAAGMTCTYRLRYTAPSVTVPTPKTETLTVSAGNALPTTVQETIVANIFPMFYSLPNNLSHLPSASSHAQTMSSEGSTLPGLAGSSVNQVVKVGNRLYVATDGGLSISTTNSTTQWYNLNAASGLGSSTVRGIFVSNNGEHLYAATSGGLSYSDDGGLTWVTKTTADGLASDQTNGVVVHGDEVYIATDDGLSIWNQANNTWSNSLSGKKINQVLRAANGDLYAAYNIPGVFPADGGLAISADNGANWADHKITSGGFFAVTAQMYGVDISGGDIYVATDLGVGISSDNGANWTVKTMADGLAATMVDAVTVHGGKIYAATAAGLSVSSDGGDHWDNYTTANGLAENHVLSVDVDAGNTVYVGTSKGLSYSDNVVNPFAEITNASGLASPRINQIKQSGDTFYAATDGGFASSSDGGIFWTNHDTSNGLGSDIVHAIALANGKLYAATANGLAISSDGGSSFPTNITSPTYGLGSNIVQALKIKNGKIYAGTANGLSISDDLAGTGSWVNYINMDEVNIYSIALASDGKIYIATEGTNGGLSVSDDPASGWVNYTHTQFGAGPFMRNGSQVVLDGGKVYLALKPYDFFGSLFGGGLVVGNVATPHGWAAYQSTNGLAADGVNGIAVDADSSGQDLYVATSGGVSISNNGGTTWSNYHSANGLSDNNVLGIALIDRTLYVLTAGGLALRNL